ncbi:MAG TPA: HAMP domain-containing sensor histidine kinase [Longimicrobium sp.]|nr:HAMP domain-containing sensor histidine kinase [Longimicrobium sp.]
MDIGSRSSYDDSGSRGLLRGRMEALGQVSAELMHDLAMGLSALEARARVAAADARAGRAPASELDQMVETSADLNLMVRDTLDVMHGKSISPEVRFDVQTVVERAVRRYFPGSRGVEVRLRSELPSNVEVEGRQSFLFRSVWNLLANAMRHCRSEVQIGVSVEDPRRMDEDAEAVVCIDIEDDGAGLDLARAATLFEPAPFGDPEGAMGLSAVAWMVSQLGGWVRHRPGDELGGACFEIRLPAVLPPQEAEPEAG